MDTLISAYHDGKYTIKLYKRSLFADVYYDLTVEDGYWKIGVTDENKDRLCAKIPQLKIWVDERKVFSK